MVFFFFCFSLLKEASLRDGRRPGPLAKLWCHPFGAAAWISVDLATWRPVYPIQVVAHSNRAAIGSIKRSSLQEPRGLVGPIEGGGKFSIAEFEEHS